jgi:hypothetical protein
MDRIRICSCIVSNFLMVLFLFVTIGKDEKQMRAPIRSCIARFIKNLDKLKLRIKVYNKKGYIYQK